MRLTCITPPAELALSEQAAWEHLRLIYPDDVSPTEPPADSAHMRRLIEGAVSDLDGATGMLARALITQAWKLTLPRFPRVIELPLPPLQAVISIEYMDAAGALQTLAAPDYVVAGAHAAGKAEVFPTHPGSWPATFCHHPEAVRVTFRAGYGDTADDIPAIIRGALMEIVARRYAFRESITPAAQYFALPRSAQDALERYVVKSF